jgi:hypothetical protein
MKKFLLTWYGITDFRASLGFENTDGPIAGALVGDPIRMSLSWAIPGRIMIPTN